MTHIVHSDNIKSQSTTHGGEERLSEKEKDIIRKLKEAIPKMSDFDKGYILGKTEKMAEESAERGEKSESIKN